MAIIGTPGAYDAGANLIRTAITAGWRTSLRVVRWIGQGITTLGRRTHAVVAGVSPVLAHRLTSVVVAVTTPARLVADTARRWVETAGQLTWMLATTDLVRTTTTRAAQAATMLIGVHALTQGAAASRLVAALP